jgi:8-oxo-dGTP pyrophosphatase MutT (NUDIX family)
MITGLAQELIRHIDEYGLPGEHAHTRLSPYGRIPASEALQQLKVKPKMSAVLILLFPEGNEIHNVLIKRPAYNGVHSGQMAFPGGRKDDTDADLWVTALREAEEEIGTPRADIRLIHAVTPVYIPPSNFLVHPFLAYADHKPGFIPDPREVDSIHTYPVHWLTEDDVIKVTNVNTGVGPLRMNVPYFDLNGQVVWGATALMLNELRDLLLRMDIRS